MEKLRIWVALPASFEHTGRQKYATAHVQLEVPVAQVDGAAAPIALRFSGQGEDLARIRRARNGTFWAPLAYRTPLLSNIAQIEMMSARTQIELAQLIGLPLPTQNQLDPSFGCDAPGFGSMPRGARIDEAWRDEIPMAVEVLSSNLMLVDGHVFRRSGMPMFSLDARPGHYFEIELVDAFPNPERPGRTCFPITGNPPLQRFAALFSKRPRALKMPDIDIAGGFDFSFDPRSLFAMGVRDWLVRRLSNPGFGNLPAAAISAGYDLRDAEDAGQILNAIARLGQALDVDQASPLTGLDEGVGAPGRFEFVESLRRVLRIPLVRMNCDWPTMEIALSPEDEAALEMF